MDKSCGLSSVICGGRKSVLQPQRRGLWTPTKEMHYIGTSRSILLPRQKVVLKNASILSRCCFKSLLATQSICSLSSSPSSIRYGAICRRNKKGLLICATSKPANSDDWPLDKRDTGQTLRDILDAFYRFSRPYAVIGTVLGIVSASLLAVQSASDISPAFWVGLLQAIIPSVFMTIYVLGLNQLYDIEIDKINKPYLPLASGEYSLKTGVAIVTAFALMSLGMGAMIGSVPLLWALFIMLVLGSGYSMDLPFLRWKRSAVATAIYILCVRGIVTPLAFFLHMQSFVYTRPGVFTKPLIFDMAISCFFSVVIALFKDIPDMDGDKKFGIQSLSLRLGQKRVFWLCVYLLQVAYGIAIIMGGVSPFAWSKIAMVLGHTVLAAVLWHQAVSVDLKSKLAITSFYMFIWKLFYAEYLLIPFMR